MLLVLFIIFWMTKRCGWLAWKRQAKGWLLVHLRQLRSVHPGAPRVVNLQNAIEEVGSVVTKMNPEGEFSYTFMDEAFLEQYQEEERLGEVFTYISFLAIFIACLGLFGLAAFMTNQRRREISIRKTLGASTTGIVLLLSREFTRLVLIAIVLAIPLAYLATTDWLEDFAYRIRLGVGIFLIATLIAISIAFLTVSYQTIKAALVNPADNLRHE